MNKRLAITGTALSLGLLAACEQSNSSPPPATPAEAQATARETLVTVDQTPITGEMFAFYLNEKFQKAPRLRSNPKVQNQVINELINLALLSHEAEKQGLDKRSDVQAAMKVQRMQLLSRMALQEYARKHPATQEEIDQAYKARYLDQKGEEYKARHILVKTEDEAKAIIAQLEKGADFASLAKEKSTGPSGKKGGDLGWFDAAQMVKPFSDAVARLKPGQFTKTPVKTQFGWHVILLEKKRAKEPPKKEAVEAQLKEQILRRHLSEHVRELAQAAKVDVNKKFMNKKPKQD